MRPTRERMPRCPRKSGSRSLLNSATAVTPMPLNKDLREFVELLNSNGVEYLVVGAFAVAFHGFPRYTADLDLLVRPTADNADRLVRTLAEFGFGGLGIRAADFL